MLATPLTVVKKPLKNNPLLLYELDSYILRLYYLVLLELSFLHAQINTNLADQHIQVMDGSADTLCSSCHSFVGKFVCGPESQTEHVLGCYSALEKSAQDGCPLCGIIVASIASRSPFPPSLLRTDSSLITLKISSDTLPSMFSAEVTSASGVWLGYATIFITQAPIEDFIHEDGSQDPDELRWKLNHRVYGRGLNRDETAGQAEHTAQWEMYCTHRDGTGICRKICDLTTETGQQQIAEMVKKWLATCCTLHKQCGALQDRHLGLPPLPTRVLDVGTLEQPHLRLHVSKSGEREEYTCLSYCWGRGVPEFKTTIATVDELQNHIPFPALPKTIQDAIVFTRRLQVRYLWVDALCIIQDNDSDPSDWQLEAARFGTYYQNALCTLAATGSHDSSEGLFLPSIDRIYPIYFSIRLHRDSKQPLYYTWTSWVHRASELVSKAPLSMRGWAAQEKILSPRIVHFTLRFVIWDCTELFSSEGSPDQEIRTGSFEPLEEIRSGFSYSFEKQRRRDHRNGWATLCNWYVKKKFSRLSDRLPALSGVVQRIQAHTGKMFYAGLWEDDIVKGLDWRVQDPEIIPGNQALIGPSWSWIHVTGNLLCRGMLWVDLMGITWMGTTSTHTHISAAEPQVLDIKVQDNGRGIGGSITSGVITISGILSTLNLAELGFTRDEGWRNKWVMDGDTHETGIHWDRLPLEVEVHGTFVCLQMGEKTHGLNGKIEPACVKALILVLVSEDAIGTPEYRRVGYGIFRQHVWNGGQPEWKEIKLV